MCESRFVKISDVTAVILAGGLGTRIRKVIGEQQKVMADVGGRPFVTFLLEQLNEVRDSIMWVYPPQK